MVNGNGVCDNSGSRVRRLGKVCYGVVEEIFVVVGVPGAPPLSWPVAAAAAGIDGSLS